MRFGERVKRHRIRIIGNAGFCLERTEDGGHCALTERRPPKLTRPRSGAKR